MPSGIDTDGAPRQNSKLKLSSDLRLLLAFLNTSEIDSPRALADWLETQKLVKSGTELGQSDFEKTVEIREAARTLLVDGPAAAVDAAAAHLDQAMMEATLRTRFGVGGRIRLEPVPGGLDRALAHVCGLLAKAQFEGTWQRVKICGAHKCGAAFFDDSKNHRRKWCSTRCCNRVTSLAFRHRNLEKVSQRDRNSDYRRRYGI